MPDLCVEVTSPNDLYVEVMGRLDEYFRCGVRQVWIVRPPEQEVHVYRNREQKSIIEAGGTLTSEDILPGFALRMGDLFK